ncbi:hypothetical protein GALL_455620 [mine drainage metagenome]|uniref:Uncharacterized protein n=1 Tax=mine drainage metagenome TaxID=410659 RepID=A0A1J5PNS4_9ZZZZ
MRLAQQQHIAVRAQRRRIAQGISEQLERQQLMFVQRRQRVLRAARTLLQRELRDQRGGQQQTQCTAQQQLDQGMASDAPDTHHELADIA